MTEVVLALVKRGERWLLQRRDQANPVLPGLWEFPGGKIAVGEAAEQALARELREETKLLLRSARACPALEGSPRLLPFLVEAEGLASADLAWGWFTPVEMGRLPVPPRNRELIAALPRDPRGPEPQSVPPHLIG
jgi:8-oxo-dGTP pyrophosphatase MutT (NUDIX family)